MEKIKGMSFGLNKCESFLNQRYFEIDSEGTYFTNKYELLTRLKRIDQKKDINQIFEEIKLEIQNARD